MGNLKRGNHDPSPIREGATTIERVVKEKNLNENRVEYIQVDGSARVLQSVTDMKNVIQSAPRSDVWQLSVQGNDIRVTNLYERIQVDQRSTVGWKASTAAKILYDDRLVIFETGSYFSNVDTAN